MIVAADFVRCAAIALKQGVMVRIGLVITITPTRDRVESGVL